MTAETLKSIYAPGYSLQNLSSSQLELCTDSLGMNPVTSRVTYGLSTSFNVHDDRSHLALNESLNGIDGGRWRFVAEHRMADEESGLMASSKAPRRSDFFLLFCRMLNFVTAVAALLCLVAHGMALLVGPSLFEVTDTNNA